MRLFDFSLLTKIRPVSFACAGRLAANASVGLSTIKDYESGKRTPIANNVDAIRRALEKAGMTITADSVSGPIK